MPTDYIALAVPFFFLLMGIEALVARRRRLAAYRFADTLADLGCGVIQRMALLGLGGALALAYVWVYQRFRVVDLARSPVAAWVIAFFGVDFVFYWWHRASHRVNVLWAAHIVHHQSEDYNMAVALRQAVLTPVTSLPFSLMLGVLGVPPTVMATSSALNTLYQFWIHTRTVGRLGALEAILNTPSHHRVHHARNAGYLDANFGGVLIIWDRLFGTFVPETEAPQFGITTPLRSFNPLWAQVHYLVDLWRLSRRPATWRDRLAVWLEPPERTAGRTHAALGAATRADDPTASPASPAGSSTGRRYDVEAPARLRRYVAVNFALAVVAAFCVMMWHGALPMLWVAVAALLVVLTVTTSTALLESRAWGRAAEAARLALIVAAVAAWAATA